MDATLTSAVESSPPETESVYDIPDTAQYLGITLSSVRTLVREGVLKPIRVEPGGRKLFAPGELEEALAHPRMAKLLSHSRALKRAKSRSRPGPSRSHHGVAHDPTPPQPRMIGGPGEAREDQVRRLKSEILLLKRIIVDLLQA